MLTQKSQLHNCHQNEDGVGDSKILTIFILRLVEQVGGVGPVYNDNKQKTTNNKKLHQAGRAGWRGGSCSSLLHGVCEFGVTGELLADPGTLVAEVIMIIVRMLSCIAMHTGDNYKTGPINIQGGRGLLAVRWGRADWGWVPSSWIGDYLIFA